MNGCEMFKCTSFKDNLCHYEGKVCKYRESEIDLGNEVKDYEKITSSLNLQLSASREICKMNESSMVWYNRTIDKQKEQLLTMSKYIVQNYRGGIVDHACGACVPGGEIVAHGFVCAYHTAKNIWDSELEDCPLCFGRGFLVETDRHDMRYQVECQNCRGRGKIL